MKKSIVSVKIKNDRCFLRNDSTKKSQKGNKMKISLCIPMYNEEKIIDSTLNTISSYMDKNFGDDYEVLFINDGSKDKCAQKVEEFSSKNGKIKLIEYGQNMGKGYAVRQGVLASQGEVIMFTDCDLAYGCDVIKTFFDRMQETNADVAVGSRNLDKSGYEGYSFARKIISKTYIKVLCVIGNLKLSDSQCGCKAFRSEMGKKVFSYCEVNRFAFDFEAILLATKFKASIIEIPVRIIENSESSMHIVRDSIKMVKDIISMKKRIKKIKE